jgi:hypothetical protein
MVAAEGGCAACWLAMTRLLLILVALWPSPAECAYCSGSPCRNGAFCGEGCVCARAPGETLGACVPR